MTMTAAVRAAPAPLEERFRRARAGPSDIHEHLDRLRELASQCEHVTEFGVRGADASTIALLAGQPATLVCWDLNPWAVVQQAVADLLVGAGRTRVQPRVGDVLEVAIEPTELLLIDTLHTYRQLREELARHALHVTRWIALHDVVTFGERGEDGSTPGLRQAVTDWLAAPFPPSWEILEDRPNNNGLMILERTR